MHKRLRRRKKSTNKVSRPADTIRGYSQTRPITPKLPAPPAYPERRPQTDKADIRLAPEPCADEPEIESGNVVQLPTQPDSAARRIENKLNKIDELLRARDPAQVEPDEALLQKMRSIAQDPDSKPAERAKASEIAKAMQWWLGSGQFGQQSDKAEDNLAIEVIVERYRDAHELEQHAKETR